MAISSSTPGISPSIVDLVGDTPLIRLRRIERDLPGVELYAKAEWKNPGGSVKDRPALRMIQEGIASGQLAPGKVILDATSGNTGIAYAMIGAAMDFKVTLCVPENVTPERKRILRAYGAELIFTNPLEGSDGAIRAAQQMNESDPGKYFYADQYNNDFNWRAHFDTTGPEIIRQAGPRVTHFVAGLGTSGTFIGVGRRLREFNAKIVLASVQPDSPLHGLEGLKHMESAIVPGIYDPKLADEDVRVGTEDAYEMTRRLAQEEGLLVGISSGANLAGALKIARKGLSRRSNAKAGAVMVVVFCDGGERYLSERFWENPPEGVLVSGTN
jgi:cysteine synthase B